MHKVVLSLTSYPARINTVNQVIESLLAQKERADEIILWLSIQEFPNKYSDIPDALRMLIGSGGFRIEWVNGNLKSHKKYFYALQKCENITITVDDDMRYSSLMVSTLMDSYRKYPHAVSARNVRMITKEDGKLSPYLAWENDLSDYVGQERMDLCAIGVNGVLYPPKCSKEDWFDLAAIKKNAENQDDLWLKFNEVITGIPVVYTGLKEKDEIIENIQGIPLYIQNAKGGDNDVSIVKLCNVLKRKHKKVYCDWLKNLMPIEKFWLIKREILKTMLDEVVISYGEECIYICGAGKYAHILYHFIKSCNMEKYITAFLITGNAESKGEIPIKTISELDVNEEFVALCGVSNLYKEEFREALELYKFCKWVDTDLLGIEKLLRWEGRS